MREILFRGKRLDNDLWEEGSLIFPLAHRQTDDPSIGDFWNMVRVDPATVGQYAGLTDQNGTKIFEGDIIKWDEREFGGPHFELVTWDYDLFAMRANDWSEFCVVCGNIHDNPELLEVKK